MRKIRSIAVAVLVIVLCFVSSEAPSFAVSYIGPFAGTTYAYGSGTPYAQTYTVTVNTAPAYHATSGSFSFTYTGSQPGNPTTANGYASGTLFCDTSPPTGVITGCTTFSVGGIYLNPAYGPPSQTNTGVSIPAGKTFDHVEFRIPQSAVEAGGPPNTWTAANYYPTGHPLDVPPAPDPAPVVTSGNCSLSDKQIAMLARSAGFTDAQLQKAVAVALAESAGKVNALNYNGPAPGSWDIGLWQINDDAHPSYTRTTLGTNPLYNGQAAHDIFVAASNSWSPWSSYTSGAYTAFMTRAGTAVTQAGTGELPLINCSGALGNPDDPDAQDAEEDGDTCSGWNPLTYFKCALRWAFVPSDGLFDQWQTTIHTVESTPPVSWVIGGVDFCMLIFDSLDGVVHGDPVPSIGPVLFHASTGAAFDPLSAANNIVHDDDNPAINSAWNYVYTAMELSILLMTFMFVWRRARNSFGGKNGE